MNRDADPPSTDGQDLQPLTAGQARFGIALPDTSQGQERRTGSVAGKPQDARRGTGRNAKPDVTALASPRQTTPNRYRVTADGIVWDKVARGGSVPVLLTNFEAKIVGEIVVDDGVEERRLFELEAKQGPRRTTFRIPAERFAGLTWVTENLGARAIVSAGYAAKDHARAAIQMLSHSVRRSQVFRHTGWRVIDGKQCFLHGGGAIAAEGACTNAEVDLPTELQAVRLAPSTTIEAVREAVRASLALLDVASERVSAPLLAACARAPIGGSSFSLHLAGRTGVGKTALGALGQQHFGPGMDAENLPASWLSTGNALEGIAFYAKDVVLVVDDFAPDGPSVDVARLHKQADRLLRAVGNRAGRGRMAPDGSLRPTKLPRALIISTGEDVPRGQSLRARAFVLEMGPDDLDWVRLTTAQEQARSGAFAHAMAGYIQWLAPRMGTLPGEFRETVAVVRAAKERSHRRTSTIEAELICAAKLYLEFAKGIAAITPEERSILMDRFERGIGEAAETQAEHQRSAEPVERFLDLLRSAMSSGAAHVSEMEGRMPFTPSRWGWRKRPGGVEYEPQGPRVGWVDEKEEVLLLDMTSAYHVVQRLGAAGGETIGIGKDTLARRMNEKRLLIVPDKGRHLTWRPSIDGGRPRVLKLRVSVLFPVSEDQEDGEVADLGDSAVPHASQTGPTDNDDVGRGNGR